MIKATKYEVEDLGRYFKTYLYIDDLKVPRRNTNGLSC